MTVLGDMKHTVLPKSIDFERHPLLSITCHTRNYLISLRYCINGLYLATFWDFIFFTNIAASCTVENREKGRALMPLPFRAHFLKPIPINQNVTAALIDRPMLCNLQNHFIILFFQFIGNQLPIFPYSLPWTTRFLIVLLILTFHKVLYFWRVPVQGLRFSPTDPTDAFTP